MAVSGPSLDHNLNGPDVLALHTTGIEVGATAPGGSVQANGVVSRSTLRGDRPFSRILNDLGVVGDAKGSELSLIHGKFSFSRHKSRGKIDNACLSRCHEHLAGYGLAGCYPHPAGPVCDSFLNPVVTGFPVDSLRLQLSLLHKPLESRVDDSQRVAVGIDLKVHLVQPISDICGSEPISVRIVERFSDYIGNPCLLLKILSEKLTDGFNYLNEAIFAVFEFFTAFFHTRFFCKNAFKFGPCVIKRLHVRAFYVIHKQDSI